MRTLHKSASARCGPPSARSATFHSSSAPTATPPAKTPCSSTPTMTSPSRASTRSRSSTLFARTESASSRACCPAAITPPAKRPTNTSMAGIWAGSSTAPSKSCASKSRLQRAQPQVRPSLKKSWRADSARPACADSNRPHDPLKRPYNDHHRAVSKQMTQRIAIVGGGIVGLATAYRLLERFPAANLLLLEKESGPGRHQTGHNSGVLHCGLYYKPGSLRARLAVEGIRKMVAFCAAHSIPHDVCGKIVVASTAEQLPRLQALHERGIANGLEGLRILGPEQIRELEPHAAGLAALHVPQEGIADYPAVAQTLAREIHGRGGEIKFSAK